MESAHGVVVDDRISVFSMTTTEVEITVSVTEAVKDSYMGQKIFPEKADVDPDVQYSSPAG